MLRPRDFRQRHWRWISAVLAAPRHRSVRRVVGGKRFVTLGKSPLASGRADRTVCKRNQLITRGSGRSAGIATTSDDQSTAWRDPRFVLPAEPCCAALQANNNNSKALRATTNGSTQHERNTTIPALFASDLDTDTIGPVVLLVVLAAFFIAAARSRRRKCPPERAGDL